MLNSKKTILTSVKYYAPFLLAACILIWQIFPELMSPTFPGDSGFRLLHASEIVVGQDKRVWLPFLQFQIHILYLLHAPLLAYKLLPLGYYLVFLFTINVMANRVLKTKFLNLLFTVLLSTSLANNAFLEFLGSNLYQEMLVLALFYILSYQLFIIKKKSVFLFIYILAAMLTREYFWIYYPAFGLFSLLQTKKPSRSNMFIYSLYGFIPLIWIMTTKGFFLGTTNNTSLSISIILERSIRLFTVFYHSSFFLLFIGLCITHIIIYLGTLKSQKSAESIYNPFGVVSLLSLVIMYIYIVINDPWFYTPTNPRAIIPFIVPLPFWVLICAKKLRVLALNARLLATSILCISIFSISNMSFVHPFQMTPSLFNREIANMITSYTLFSGKKSPIIGIVGIDYWHQYVKYLSGPLLYVQNEYFTINSSSLCNKDILVATSDGGTCNNMYQIYRQLQLPDNTILYVWFKKPE